MNNPSVSGTTQVCGIIGDPIGHSLSPEMQNAAFEAEGLNFIYLPFRVKKEDLGDAISGIRALNIRGLNVTIPHKVHVIPFLDEIDILAEKIGAVNTIVNEKGILKGYNTDASGFMKTLQEQNIEPRHKNITVLGAGGAARSIAFVLAESGARLTILNRHPETAQDLADNLNRAFGIFVKAVKLSSRTLAESLDGADILVNTTSVGMLPDIDSTPVPENLIKSGLIVVDIIYNPLQTRLLKEAEKKGARVISGIEMLIWQGALAFELWTGKKAPLETMRKVVMKGA
jgi:shikimate dehydrogenase